VSSGRFVELSHPIDAGMITYAGLPGPVVSEFLTREASRDKYADGTTFSIGRVDMVANTGTYVDAPSHRYADGADLADLRLESLADLDGVVIRRVGMGRVVDRDAFAGISVEGRAVLIHTGWDRHWGSPAYGTGNPYVTSDAAEYLVHQGAVLVGIDSLNIDDTADGTRPAHTVLLGARVTIVEHLTGLERLPDRGFRFFAVPVKVRGMGSFPVRAFARVP
jgi:kynurenine formamidase